VGDRYKSYNDYLIRILGGDRLPDEREGDVKIWGAMAEGITDTINGHEENDRKADYTTTFMTYHCFSTSSRWFHEDPWIDMQTWGS